jgi:hypothetical protein
MEQKIFKKNRPEENVSAESSLSKKQKLALFGLGIFAICIFVFWGVELKNNISDPFKSKAESAVIASGEQCPDGNCQQAIEEKSKITDTDNDGLFDWDELNKYNTSPYLNDSDSDGIDDGIEVKNSTDPNCAQGRDCSLSGYLVSGASSTVSSVPQASASETEIIKANAEILRQALLDSKSVDKETLDKISDEDLLTIYQLAAEEAASSTEQ